MAQTGYTPIYLYYSGTATHIPLAANLGNGELAINAADGNLFYKNTSNAVVTIPVLQSSSTQSGWLSSTDWNTFNSKAPAGAYLTSVTADSPLTGAGTSASHLSIPAATESVNGYLTSTDWTTFNNKQPAGSYLTTVTADSPLTGSGTSGSHLSMPAATGSVNGYLTSTDWTTFNSKQPAGTYVTSVSGTAPVVSSGGTTPAISMAAATGSVNGYLTSTDWTTFNNKSPAAGSSSITTVGTITSGTWHGSTIGTGYGGTGLTSFTANGVVYASSTSALATGSGLQFDGSNLGINVAPSAWRSDYKATTVNDISLFSSTAANDRGIANNCYASSPSGDYIYVNNGYASRLLLAYNGQLYYQRAVSGTAGGTVSFTNSFIVDDSNNVQVPAGNLVIGTSGKGIDFSATPQPSGMTSELLADYEEGTWTPTITSSGTAPTVTYTTQTGYYTKIGRMVYCQIVLNFNITVGGTGVVIASLPYVHNGDNQTTNFAHQTIGLSSGAETYNNIAPSFGAAQGWLYTSSTGTASSAAVTGSRSFIVYLMYAAS